MRIVRLVDESAADRLEAFCRVRPYERVFLRQQIRAWPASLRVGVLEENRTILAVASLDASGTILVLGAPSVGLVGLVAGIGGFRAVIGPDRAVAEALRAPELAVRPISSERSEDILGLEMDDLTGIPEAVTHGRVDVRLADASQADELIAIRREFRREVFGSERGGVPVAEEVRDQLACDALWVAMEAGQIHATLSLHLRFPDLVVLGGGWARPESRFRGYGRCVAAGALLAARARGIARAALFTANAATGGAVAPLGFRRRGLFATALFETHLANGLESKD